MSDNEITNPSSGLPMRNPTHIEEANNAEDQSDIVRAIRDSGVKRMIVSYDYSNMDKQSPPPLSGITKIREMNAEQAKAYCRNLMRSKPNIFRLHIKLGEYDKKKRIVNAKTRLLDSAKARFHTEVGDKIGDLLADKTMLVTEINYKVENNEPGTFRATAEVWGVDQEDYFNNETFTPTIQFEFIKTT